MRAMLIRHAICLLLFLSLPSHAARLPGKLSLSDLNVVVETVGGGATTKLLRSAEIYPLFPGLRLAMEIAVVPTVALNELGNQLGSLPTVTPIPRFSVTKGLFDPVELSISLAPVSFGNGILTWGGLLKIGLLDEAENEVQVSGLLSFTTISAFSDDYSGRNVELGAVLSKDLVRIKPYFGLGILFAKGSVNPNLSATIISEVNKNLFHAFGGVEFNLPVDLGIQVDWCHSKIAGAFFFGKKF